MIQPVTNQIERDEKGQPRRIYLCPGPSKHSVHPSVLQTRFVPLPEPIRTRGGKVMGGSEDGKS